MRFWRHAQHPLDYRVTPPRGFLLAILIVRPLLVHEGAIMSKMPKNLRVEIHTKHGKIKTTAAEQEAAAQVDFKLGLTDEFNLWFGRFHGAWLSADLTVDYMIGRLLKLRHEQTHRLLAGMETGRKMRILYGLLRDCDLKHRAKALQCLGKLQNESKRNIFAHSFLWSDEHAVTFVNRAGGQKYSAEKHRFTMIRFRMHVAEFLSVGRDFYESLEIDMADIQAFGEAAISAASSSKTSPTPPKAKA
jgi:hypothetical protein